jgi:hypothetical protein
MLPACYGGCDLTTSDPFHPGFRNASHWLMVRLRQGRFGLEPGGRLLVWLVLLTLLRSAGVLWFMNAAVTSESAAAQQRVMEAYRGQLRLVRARMDPLWRAHIAQLDGAGSLERQFERLITEGHADGAVLLDEHGDVLYPERSTTSAGVAVDESRGVDDVARRRIAAGFAPVVRTCSARNRSMRVDCSESNDCSTGAAT